MKFYSEQQVLDYVKSMEVLIGCTGKSVMTRGFEEMEGYEYIRGDVMPDGTEIVVLQKQRKREE